MHVQIQSGIHQWKNNKTPYTTGESYLTKTAHRNIRETRKCDNCNL